jgi:ABC-type proline/glycine betaine transport system substrate-binding protein
MQHIENLEQVRTNEISHLKETNEIQMSLIMRALGENASENEMEEWMIAHSSKVRAIFDDMVEENPAVLDNWKNKINREAILEEIERRML